MEISHLKKTFRCNGYSSLELAPAPKQRSQTGGEGGRHNDDTISKLCVDT
jgi:hypothetical protein